MSRAIPAITGGSRNTTNFWHAKQGRRPLVHAMASGASTQQQLHITSQPTDPGSASLPQLHGRSGPLRNPPTHLRMVIMDGPKMPTIASNRQKASSCTLPSKLMGSLQQRRQRQAQQLSRHSGDTGDT